MTDTRMNRGIETWCKPLRLEPDPDDLRLRARNMAPALVTQRLHELVPLLAFIGSELAKVEREATEWAVPLAGPALNQNGSHQASVFYLLADDTVGVDMVAALPVQLWQKRGVVHHLAPATGSMTADVRISAEEALGMPRSLIEKGHRELTGVVHSDGQFLPFHEGCVTGSAAKNWHGEDS